MIRSPIISVLGHVDHGKSSILDAVRDSNILATEAGAITQSIGASMIPADTLKHKAGKLLELFKIDVKLPGLLFIDTPGHAAFTSLRKRGGNLADIAILVVDINEGFKPQTIEAIEILKSSKTPFVIAANKIDLIPDYRRNSNSFLEDFKSQSPRFQQILEEKIYKIVGEFYEKFEIPTERFDRADFTKNVAIVPISAKQNVGIQELLAVLLGLSQKFLEENLKTNIDGEAKGIVLEVKEEKGLGTTLDVIIYDGSLHKNDTVVIGGIDKPIISKVRALLQPAPLKEMRDKKTDYIRIDKVMAACGVKLSCPDIDQVFGGMPIIGNPKNLELAKKEVQSQVDDVLIETDKEGIVVKADNIGSLEALLTMLKEEGIPVKKARIGNINRRDLVDAEANFENNPFYSTILGFNVSTEQKHEHVKIITAQIVYQLIDELKLHKEEIEKLSKKQDLDKLTMPAKFKVLNGCIFRQRNPCILGVEILQGTLKPGISLMKDGKKLTRLKGIQDKSKQIPEAVPGDQVALDLPDVTAGRQIFEEDVLYTLISEEDFVKLKNNIEYLRGDEKTALKEIAEVMRRNNPVWGL